LVVACEESADDGRIPVLTTQLSDATIPPAMNTTTLRENWDGHPVEYGDAWVLRKGDKVARCSLVTHQLGWELRLITTDLLRSQVCRSTEEVLTTHEHWKTALVAKGWR